MIVQRVTSDSRAGLSSFCSRLMGFIHYKSVSLFSQTGSLAVASNTCSSPCSPCEPISDRGDSCPSYSSSFSASDFSAVRPMTYSPYRLRSFDDAASLASSLDTSPSENSLIVQKSQENANRSMVRVMRDGSYSFVAIENRKRNIQFW